MPLVRTGSHGGFQNPPLFASVCRCRLQDWRCLWCRAMTHTHCRPQYPVRCPLGPCRVSIVPPTALHSVGTYERTSESKWDFVFV